METAAKGCSTCQTRKVRCDRLQPVCKRCVQSGRTCGGYHDTVRLSWPRGNNHRRAMTVNTSFLPIRKSGKFSFVQSTVWDMELHFHLAEGWEFTKNTSRAIINVIDPLSGWSPHKLSQTDKQLIQYFESTAFNSLTTLSTDPSELRNTLFRIAFSSDSPASAAVLYSMLAIASLHYQGPQSLALQHQTTAISRLSESINHGANDTEAWAHSVAGLMLCAFDIQQHAVFPRKWLWYVYGSRNIVRQASSHRSLTDDSDVAIVLDWTHYYDVLALFSAQHWHKPSLTEINRVRRKVLENPLSVPYPVTLSHQVLQVLAEIVKSVVDPTDPKYHTDDYWRHLEKLELKLKDISPTNDSSSSHPTEAETSTPTIVKLYQLAALIYLERASKVRAGQQVKIRHWLDDAFSILEGLQICPWSVPLLIIGFEARSDEQRLIILELISRTGKHTYAKNLSCLETLLRISWTQDDLGENGYNYLERVSRIMSLSDNPPTLG